LGVLVDLDDEGSFAMNATYSVSEFCRDHGISRGLFYNLLRDGQGPRVMKLGRRTLISQEAAEEWRRTMEAKRRTA
jgi:predicted DNA-binding transcriptional regulator AlpA